MPAAGRSSRVKRAAVVVHPGKHPDLDAFRAVVYKAMADFGWAEPLWLETSPETGQVIVLARMHHHCRALHRAILAPSSVRPGQ